MAKAYFLMVFYICKKVAEWTNSPVDEKFLSELREPRPQKDQESQTDMSMSKGQVTLVTSRSKSTNKSPNEKKVAKETGEVFKPKGCPICLGEMVMRRAFRGGQFWGCAGYGTTGCRGTWSLDGVPGPIRLVNEACYERTKALTREVIARQQTSQPESTASGTNELF